MRWADSEARHAGHLARQVLLNLWGFTVLTVLGMVRIVLTWPDGYRWALIPMAVSAVVQVAATRLPWGRLSRSAWTDRVLIGGYASAIVSLFLFCLPDPDAAILFPIGAILMTVATASTSGSRPSLAIGATALAGYLALGMVRPIMSPGLGVSVVAVLAVVIGLCVLTAHNRRLQQSQRDSAERRVAALLENGSDAVLAIADGQVQYVSSSAGRVLGRGDGTLGVEELIEMAHPDEMEMVIEWIGRLRAGGPGHTSRMESRSRHVDGHYIDVETTGTNHLDDPDIGRDNPHHPRRQHPEGATR